MELKVSSVGIRPSTDLSPLDFVSIHRIPLKWPFSRWFITSKDQELSISNKSFSIFGHC